MAFLSIAQSLARHVERHSTHPFATRQNFLDPQWTDDKKPYAPEKYKSLIQEAYIITKNTYMSYEDVLNMSPLERECIIDNIKEEFKKFEKTLNEQKKK